MDITTFLCWVGMYFLAGAICARFWYLTQRRKWLNDWSVEGDLTGVLILWPLIVFGVGVAFGLSVFCRCFALAWNVGEKAVDWFFLGITSTEEKVTQP